MTEGSETGCWESGFKHLGGSSKLDGKEVYMTTINEATGLIRGIAEMC